MSLISHSNGFKAKKPDKKLSNILVVKIIAVILLLIGLIGVVSNTVINSKNEKKFEINDKYVTIDNNKNYYSLSGEDKPTVIFESSSGMGVAQWDIVRNVLEEDYGIKTFAYDRDGFGFSDFSKEKSPELQAKELKLILRKVALNGPYILVGEGYGSLVMTNFSKLYPELVEGVVLVSPISEDGLNNADYYEYFAKDKLRSKLRIFGSYTGINNLFSRNAREDELKKLHNLLNESDYNNFEMKYTTTDFCNAYYSELMNVIDKTSKSQSKGMFGEVPYIVITSEKYKDEQGALQSLGGENTKVVNSGVDSNIIALEKPDIVVDSIEYIIEKLSLQKN